MAYDALRTIMPIAGLPEERAREVQISVSGTLGPRFADDSPLTCEAQGLFGDNRPYRH